MVVEKVLALSPPDRTVDIRCVNRGREIQVIVMDRRPGVPAETRERLFESFAQQDATIATLHEGLGIELHLARRIMQAHGGGISVRPREGGGSIFTLAFRAFVPEDGETIHRR